MSRISTSQSKIKIIIRGANAHPDTPQLTFPIIIYVFIIHLLTILNKK